jgi:hypothetical protein
MVTVIVITTVLTVVAGAALTITASSVNEVESEQSEIQALYMAEAAVNAAVAEFRRIDALGGEVPERIGAPDDPARMQDGAWWTEIQYNGDGSYTLNATGASGNANRTLSVVLESNLPDPFDQAMFAGNLSGDELYALELGGTGGQADRIVGDVYSGGDVVLSGDADITGTATAGGTITGMAGETGVEMTVPPVLEVDFETFHDVDVALAFVGAPRVYDDAGGTAGQLPESHAAHIFRLNPSDRTSDTNGTVKDDYFLEDPYEQVHTDPNQNGKDAYTVTIPAEFTNKVYFVDGNLWLHNRYTYSLKLFTPGGDTRVTFVVKGNVYFSDNLFYNNKYQDGVAFIALADPEVDDSGNIYFGDPVFGTMRHADALMFAEKDFYDKNLDAMGTEYVTINGNMTAGNQIAIDRDYKLGNGSVAHTRLEITFDDRQKSGALNLPGIPTEWDFPPAFEVLSWREVATANEDRIDTRALARQYDGAPPATSGTLGELAKGSAPEPDSTSGWRKDWTERFGDRWKQKNRKPYWAAAKSSGHVVEQGD